MKKNSYTPENWGKETVSAIKDITNAVTDGNTIPGQDILVEPKDPKKLTPEEIHRLESKMRIKRKIEEITLKLKEKIVIRTPKV